MTLIRLSCSLIALVLIVDRIAADAGLPAPSLDLTLHFKNLDEYPHHDFYVRVERRFGGRVNSQKLVAAGTPFHVGGRRSGVDSIRLIAVPRDLGIALPDDPKAPLPPGCLLSQPLQGDGHDTPLIEYSGYDIAYRVRLEGNRLDVEWVEANLNEWWSNARLIAIVVGLVCTLIPLGIVALVVTLIVRSGKRRRSEDAA